MRWRRLAFVVGTGALLLAAAAAAWVGFWTHEYETSVLPRASWLPDGRNTGNEQYIAQRLSSHEDPPYEVRWGLLVIGDSTAVGMGSSYEYSLVWPASSDATFPSWANLGIVGARLHDVVGQLTFVRRLVYEDMVLSVGANDATHLTSLASYRTDMRKLAAYLATRPPGHTFVFTAPDMSLVPALPIGYRTLVGMRAAAENRILREEMPSTVIIVDIYNQGKLDPKVDPWLYAEDQFHPSDKGYAIWASVLQKAQHP